VRLSRVVMDTWGMPVNVAIAPEAKNSTKNWITVITGENGARKSFFLRLIAHAAQLIPAERDHRFPSAHIAIEPAPIHPINTIALSGTPHDRFPITAGIPIARKPSQFDTNTFNFFGARNSASPTSRSQGLAVLVHSLLEGPISKQRNRALASIFSRLGYLPRLEITLVPRGWPRNSSSLRRSVRDLVLKQARIVSTRLGKTSRHPLYRFLQELLQEDEMLDRVLGKIQDPVSMAWDFEIDDNEEIFREIDGQLLRNLIQTGILVVDQMDLCTTSPHSYSQTNVLSAVHLSSGQWQFLYSLANLALTIKSDSLVLVDEPENSFHPQWQREYISTLREVIGIVKGVHAIVVTHSPLIASGVQPKEGNQLRLQKMEDETVKVIEEEPVYGWLPDDVMQNRFNMDTARAPEIEELASVALTCLKEPRGQKNPKFIEAVKRLDVLAMGLPAADPLNAVVETLRSYLPKAQRNAR
jgi:type IV secretory pathway protease TraF